LEALIFSHFARAALLALSLRSSAVIFAALALPPFFPPLLPIAAMNWEISDLLNCAVDRKTISWAA
jgi:hypothetical protein